MKLNNLKSRMFYFDSVEYFIIFLLKKYKKFYLHVNSTILLVSIFNYSLISAQNVFEVIGEGEAIVANITPKKARKKAIEEARINALEKMGIEINQQVLYLKGEGQSNFIDNFIRLIHKKVKAKIVNEEIIKWENNFLEDGTLIFKVKMKIHAIPEIGNPDPEFDINLRLNQQIFHDDEEMIIKITPSKDCYLYIFNLMANDTLLMIYPNSFFEDNFHKANTLFTFPPPSNKAFSLIVKTLPSKFNSEELIIAIATKNKIPFSQGTFDTNESVYLPTLRSALVELNRWLLNFSLFDRTESIELYKIIK